MRPNLRLLVTAAGSLLLGAAIGALWRGETGSPHGDEVSVVRQKGYRFTNPLLECEFARFGVENRALVPFRLRLEQHLEAAGKAGLLGEGAVYFRDLANGHWTTVNPVANFVPASLLKVPMMMAVLQRNEQDPAFLSRKVRFPPGGQDLNANESVRPSHPIEPGGEYTVEELVRHMIEQSDNNAAFLLAGLVPAKEVAAVFEGIGVDVGGVKGNETFLSVEEYASFFRILYNASYLDRKLSEKALSILAGVEYADALVAGVPAGVPVAHKFGEWTLNEPEPYRQQLHDCGIVYHPNRPYLLCVMTRGNQRETLDEVIAGVSRLVYEQVSSQTAGGAAP